MGGTGTSVQAEPSQCSVLDPPDVQASSGVSALMLVRAPMAGAATLAQVDPSEWMMRLPLTAQMSCVDVEDMAMMRPTAGTSGGRVVDHCDLW